jgi:hypothetical protein
MLEKISFVEVPSTSLEANDPQGAAFHKPCNLHSTPGLSPGVFHGFTAYAFEMEVVGAESDLLWLARAAPASHSPRPVTARPLSLRKPSCSDLIRSGKSLERLQIIALPCERCRYSRLDAFRLH